MPIRLSIRKEQIGRKISSHDTINCCEEFDDGRVNIPRNRHAIVRITSVFYTKIKSDRDVFISTGTVYRRGRHFSFFIELLCESIHRRGNPTSSPSAKVCSLKNAPKVSAHCSARENLTLKSATVCAATWTAEMRKIHRCSVIRKVM